MSPVRRCPRLLWTQLGRLYREDEGVELLEWAVLALVLTGLIGAYVALRDQAAALVEQAANLFS